MPFNIDDSFMELLEKVYTSDSEDDRLEIDFLNESDYDSEDSLIESSGEDDFFLNVDSTVGCDCPDCNPSSEEGSYENSTISCDCPDCNPSSDSEEESYENSSSTSESEARCEYCGNSTSEFVCSECKAEGAWSDREFCMKCSKYIGNSSSRFCIVCLELIRKYNGEEGSEYVPDKYDMNYDDGCECGKGTNCDCNFFYDDSFP